MWRYTTIPPNWNQTNSNLSAVALQSATTASQLAALIAQNNAASSGGISVSEQFSEYTGNTLPAQWTVQPSPNAGFGIYRPSNTSFDNNKGIHSPIAWFYQYLSGPTRNWAQHTKLLTTDSVSIQAIFGSVLRNDYPTTIFCHASTAMDAFVYCNCFSQSIHIGIGSWNSSTQAWTFTEWTFFSTDVAPGDNIEIKNTGVNWTVNQNGVALGTYADNASTAKYDSTHRAWGYAIAGTNSLFALDDISGGLTSIVASDIAVPVYIGTGWNQYRASTSSISPAGAGDRQLPTNCLDTTTFAQNVTTIDSNGIGGIQIQKEGFYVMVFRWLANATAGDFASYRCHLYFRNATITDTLQLLQYGGDHSANATGATATFIEYLRKGNIVYPGVGSTNGTPGIVGNAGGSNTYWEGVRIGV